MPSGLGDAMKRHSRAGGEPIKGQRRKTPEPKSRNAPKAPPARSNLSVGREETEVARLRRELNEAREQQTATGDVLTVISRSSFDLQAVLDTLVKLAARLCAADLVAIHRPQDGAMQFAANFGLPQEWEEIVKRAPIVPGRGTATARVLLTGKVVQIADVEADPEYTFTEGQRAGGFRTVLAVPLEREGETIGVIVLCRRKVHPFTDKQIDLVKNFAAQAVIAIENARLLNELRQRTTDLSEALKQQTATSDLLQVISGFPGNLEPVFQAMLENAVEICGANLGNMFLCEDDKFRTVAMYNAPEAYAKARMGGPFLPPSDSLLGHLAATKEVAQVADLKAEQRYINRVPHTVEAVELAGIRTAIAVPMLKEGHLVGAIVIFRQEVRPFGEKQIELVKNFANQAVIAIENARLLKELRERTDEVEKLNQQLEQRVADQVDEIERMSRLRRFLPPQVADLIVSSGSEKQLESHRREITALFCDLRGFTGFTESADAEDVMALLRDYHAAIGEIIIKYNGTLERYAGDGVMVVFNDPVPVENPALQAVLMALEVRDAIGALTETWRRLGHDIGFGIGIAHGFATLGTIGFEGTLRLRGYRDRIQRRLSTVR